VAVATRVLGHIEVTRLRLALAMTALVFALGCARGTRPSASEAVGQGKVLSASSGETLTIIPLLPAEGRKFLLYFQGTKDDADGKVLLHQATPSLREFYARWRGRDIRFLNVERRGSLEQYYLTVLNRDEVVFLQLDETRTQALKAEDVYALHQRQLADGTISRGEQFDRTFWLEEEQRVFTKSAQALNEACGTPVDARIVWDSVSDEQLNEHSISSYCTPPLEALRELCSRSEEARRTVQARVKALDCRIGGTMEPRVEAEKVLWTTPVGPGSLSQEATTSFFLDNL
jgi:hypothetical protein